MAKVGRKTVDTPDTRRKLEEAAAIDCSVEEMAFYADISRDSYHEIMKKDKVFSDRIEALRNRPVIKARQTVNNKVTESYQNAMDYLKRKKRDEFGDSASLNVKGEITSSVEYPELKAIRDEYEKKLRDKISNETK